MQCLLFQTTLTQFLLFQTTIKQFLLFQPTLMQFLLFQTTLMHMFYFSLPSWRTCSVPVFLSCMLLPAAVAWDKAAGSRRSSYSSLLVKLGTRIMILVNALPRHWREGKNRCVTLCRNKKNDSLPGDSAKMSGITNIACMQTRTFYLSDFKTLSLKNITLIRMKTKVFLLSVYTVTCLCTQVTFC